MAADGRILIDTKIDTSGFDAGAKEIIAAARRMAKDLDSFSDSVSKAFSQDTSAIEATNKELQETGSQLDKLDGKTVDIEITGLEKPKETPDIEEEPQVVMQSAESMGYDKEAMKFVEEYGNKMQSAGEKADASIDKNRTTLLSFLAQAKTELKELANTGLGPGDAEYDAQAQKIAELTYELSTYTKGISEAAQKEIYGLDTIEGKIAAVNQKIAELSGVGLGIESPEMQEQLNLRAELLETEKNIYKEVTKTASQRQAEADKEIARQAAIQAKADAAAQKEEARRAKEEAAAQRAAQREQEKQAKADAAEAKRAAAEEARLQAQRAIEVQQIMEQQRLQEIANTAQVSSDKIVQMSEEIAQLGARQAELEKAGVGLGHEEYDQNITKIAELKQEIDNYKKSLLPAKDSQNQFKQELDKTSDSADKLGNAAKKSGNDFKGFGRMMLKYGIGVESLFTLVNQLRSALVEGFQNLAQYSSNTNTTISGLMSSLAQCKNALATAFDPILQAVAPALNYMISLVTAAATAVAQLIAILTGKGTFTKATKVQKDYAKSIKGTGGAAKEAGEEAEGALAPFDRLTVMAEESASGGGGGGGGGGEMSPADMFETVEVDNGLTKAIEAIKTKLLELKDLFKTGFFEGLGDLSVFDSIQGSIDSIKTSLTSIFLDGTVLAAANNMINTLVYDMGRITGSFASIGLSILDNIVAGFALYLADAQERIKGYLVSMFDITSEISTITGNFSVALAEIFTVFRSDDAKQITADIIAIFSDSFMGITELAYKLFRDLVDIVLTPFTENKDAIKEALENFFAPVSEVLGTLRDGVVETFSELNKMYDEHLKPMFNSFRDGITQIVKTLLDGYNKHMAPVLDRLAKKFDEVWKSTIQPLINTAIGLIGDVADLITVLWENILVPLLDWFAATVFPVIAPVIEGIGAVFLAAFDIIGTVLDTFLKSIRAVIQFITEGFQTDWGTAWDNMGKKFSDIWDAFPGVVKGVVNRIIDSVEGMLNGVISGLNGFGDKINGMIKGIVGDSSISIPTIPNVHLPRLASGTVVPPRAGEFAAILGDNNRETEVVSPLSTMKQAFLDAIAQSGGMGGGDINLIVNLDGRVVYQDLIKRNRAEVNRTGNNPLMA